MTKKSKPKLATMEDYANAEFEPWTDSMPSPDKVRLNFKNHYAVLQLAFATMQKSKPDLVEFWHRAPDESGRALVKGLQQTEKFFTAMAKVCGAAEMRLLVAASAQVATAILANEHNQAQNKRKSKHV